ncbi:antitoxin Xre-like helix-turn-helix domain-containing protein [Pseudomonas sp. CJQ_11]|uniref:antitoxin Xre-like helix-turn-helix domain-containing protein n=1 Tax=Pseudomonas sp. CJQ_11 TaxID=3367169 RepID=UPI00370C59FE
MARRDQFSKEQCSAGLRAALCIIIKWQASPRQACSILRISQSTLRRVNQGRNAGRRLDFDQQERIGLILEIHALLRGIFSDQENVHRFPSLKNDNPFFEGRSPLEVMSSGDINLIYETFKRIRNLRYLGQS